MKPNKERNQCAGKKRFSRHRAEQVRIDCMRRRNRRIRIYECELCHHYHLTSTTRY